MICNKYLATYDTESSLYHMTVNIHDTQLAFIENHGIGEHCDDFYVQIYDVGRSKTDDEIVNYYFSYGI